MATAIAPAPSSTGMTLEQYLHTSFSPDVDFIEGEIQERNLGEDDHASLQWLIAGTIMPRQRELGIRGRTEMRIRVSPNRVRICDLTLLAGDAPYEPVTVTPPLVCIEILSPEDRLSRAIKVLDDYRAMGVPHIWLIDPQERLAYVFGEGGLKQQEDLILHADGTEIRLDLNPLFVELDLTRNKNNA